MLLAEFQAITTQIAQNLGNQALVTTLLTQLNEDYSQESTNKENLTKQVGEFTQQVDNLQKTNMQLFLKIGQPAPTESINKTEPTSYEDLLGNWDKKETK